MRKGDTLFERIIMIKNVATNGNTRILLFSFILYWPELTNERAGGYVVRSTS